MNELNQSMEPKEGERGIKFRRVFPRVGQTPLGFLVGLRESMGRLLGAQLFRKEFVDGVGLGRR